MVPSIAVSTAAYDGYDLEEACERLSALGVDTVEPAYIDGYTAPFTEDAFLPAAAQRVRQTLQHSGLRCLAVSMHADLGDPAVAAHFERRLEYAAAIGARFVISNAAAPAARPQLVAHLHRLAAQAQELGLIIALENPGNRQTNVVDDGRTGAAFCREFDHPHVRLNYDFGNLISHRPGVDSRRDCAAAVEMVVHLHIKDVVVSAEGYEFPAVGTGAVGYGPILADVARAAESLPLSLELPLRLSRRTDASPRRSRERVPIEQIDDLVAASLKFVRTHLTDRAAKT